ncbi:hypothetical protein MUY14_26290 [Amycolatopsis sp. FBCC-B4732]|uniref:Uncharacterized protein n=1 Tax=Amycolatopsis eburnea TaxID=2267691 RepID=A0A3R9FT80_9PSEU|nr:MULTISPECIES: hypothetical protein [Amycolatopsis]RSD23957.1 hypothetical protein EIY87_06190 [Amycolatopsis eburnea]UOX85301.1 hypothetical protein MUY14_26290 [Amycolatopsis sp. FBCC-B4732]
MSPTDDGPVADDYDLEGFAEKLKRDRDGHQALYETTGREADRAYAAAYAQALHELFAATYGDFGEPLAIYNPDQK